VARGQVISLASSIVADDHLRSLLETLDPRARDALRRVLIHDQDDRDAISSRLMRYRDKNGDDWADIIDMLTMYPKSRGRSFGSSGNRC
jgi:hypothetical protein